MTMTTSANIAGTIQPFAVSGRGAWPYGKKKIYHIDELKPKKRKKKKKTYEQLGMLYVGKTEDIQEAYTVPVGNPKDNLWKIPKLGKVGVWRTVRGRRYFFPIDGSGPIPKIKGMKKAKGKTPGRNLYAGSPKEKKSLLKKMIDLLGGGGGAKAGLKDVKPKGKAAKKATKKKESGGSIPGGKKMLKKVDQMLAKSGETKSGKTVAGPLKKMQKALQNNDPKAFRKAEAALAKASKKLAKRKG